MCRSICRRAERSVVPLVEREEVDPTVQRYLNRLSDFLYVASRWSVEFDKVEEVPWVPHKKFSCCWCTSFVCYHFFSSMEDSSFEDEFYDVMSSGRLPLNHSAASAPRKGMSPFLLEEMKKQLEVPLWIP